MDGARNAELMRRCVKNMLETQRCDDRLCNVQSTRNIRRGLIEKYFSRVPAASTKLPAISIFKSVRRSTAQTSADPLLSSNGGVPVRPNHTPARAGSINTSVIRGSCSTIEDRSLDTANRFIRANPRSR